MSKFLLLFTLIFGGLYVPAFGQQPKDIKLSKNLVIQNVLLPSKSTKSPKKVSISIVNGVIADIGRNIKIPNDAILLDGDSLYAYPSFIDLGSNIGIPKPENGGYKRASSSSQPTWKEAGITPSVSVHDLFKGTDKRVAAAIAHGIAVSHVVPRGKMLPGMGSIVLLDKGKQLNYLKKDNTQFGTFNTSGSNAYPTTTMGVMAKYRDMFQQAKDAKDLQANYALRSNGIPRPQFPVEVQNLIPVVEGKRKLFFQGDKYLTLSRILTLNKDLGAQLVLVGTKQADLLAKRLKKTNTPVAISLDLPKAFKAEKKDSIRNLEPRRKALIEKKKASIAAYENQAKSLLDQGIPVGVSFMDIEFKDMFKQLRRMKAAGMTDQQLLDILSISPARILGVDKMVGSLESGKIANIILSTGPIFDKESQIRYHIIEGKKHEFSLKTKSNKKKKSKKKE